MNTISIILAKNGDVARLKKDFDLYQDSYKNVALDIYVPNTILPPDVTFSGETAGSKSAAVYVGSEQVTRSGHIVYSKKYNVPLATLLVDSNNLIIRDFTADGTTFAKFSTLLPRAFVLERGDTNVITNVVLVNSLVDPVIIEKIVTSQVATMQVLPSKKIVDEDVLIPTDVERLDAAINYLSDKKQDKQDGHLETANKTVVGAINENKRRLDTVDTTLVSHLEKINTNSQKITANTTEINKLKESAYEGLNRVGTYESETNPVYPYSPETIALLNNFVLQKEGRPAQKGDYIEWYNTVNETKFEIYYNQFLGQWQKPDELAPQRKATNDHFGVVRGSLNDTGANVLVDIPDGKITDIYIKNKVVSSNESYDTASVIVNQLGTTNKGIIDGTIEVGKAKTSISDQYGNQIDTSYAKVSDVYSKEESDDKFLPSTYSNTYYYVNPTTTGGDGLVDTIPTQSTPQFVVTTSQILDNLIFEVFRTTVGKYKFTKNSTDRSVLWISASTNCTLNFRLTTSVEIDGQRKLLAADLSGDIELKENIPTPITINTNYGALGDEVVEVLPQSKIIKKLEVIAPDSTPYTISVWSNETFTSTFQLLAQGLTFDVNTINGKLVVYKRSTDWTELGANNWLVKILQAEHKQAPSTEYGVEVQTMLADGSYQSIVCSPVIHTDGTIDIYSEYPLDIRVLIWTSIVRADFEIITYNNPQTLDTIDYEKYGGMKVLQTETPSDLTLPTPTKPTYFYKFFVSNSKDSTHPINVNGNVINAGKGLEFAWSGDWAVQLNPITTSEIEDDVNGQALNTTLLDLEDYCNNLDATKADNALVQQNSTNISLLGGSKQNCEIEKYEGNLPVSTIEDFRNYFYELRKSPTRTWQFEVSSSTNINLMDVLGWPNGNGKSAFVYVNIPYSEAGGFEIDLTYMERNGQPINKRVMSSTLNANWKDTGWYNLRPRWIDNINGDITLVDTNEISMDIGAFKNPYGNALIMEITKGTHSYNSFLLLDRASKEYGETTVKLDNEDVYISINYDTTTFKISKNSQGTETLKLHIYEEV